MAYLYVYNYIGYAFSIIVFMLSTLLVYYEFKGHQIAIKQVIFHYSKVSFPINMISTSFSKTINEYLDK